MQVVIHQAISVWKLNVQCFVTWDCGVMNAVQMKYLYTYEAGVDGAENDIKRTPSWIVAYPV